MLSLDISNNEERTATLLCRGVRRLLWALGHASVTEFALANGRRADIFTLDRDASGPGIAIVEIKSSIADFRTDRKWPEYRAFCDRFFFAVGEDFPQALIPESCGLIVGDAFGAAIVRPSPVERITGVRRKSLIATFAQVAATRLHRLEDPLLSG